jgi:hypothetical protein
VNVACNGSNINPVALNLLNKKSANGTYLIPTPQRYSTDTNGNPVGLSSYSIPAHFSEDQFMVNTAWVITAKHTLSERYFYSNDPQNLPFSTCSCTPGNGSTPTFNSQVAVLKLTSALNAHLLNEALISLHPQLWSSTDASELTYDQIGMTARATPPIR